MPLPDFQRMPGPSRNVYVTGIDFPEGETFHLGVVAGIEGNSESTFPIPKGPYPALTDIGFMAKVSSGSADVSVDFTILLEAT